MEFQADLQDYVYRTGMIPGPIIVAKQREVTESSAATSCCDDAFLK